MHLRLALTTIKDPIPETLYLPPTDEESLLEDWTVAADWDVASDTETLGEEGGGFEEWEDCWGLLLAEAEGLVGEVGRWREECERDLREWHRGEGGASVVAVDVDVAG